MASPSPFTASVARRIFGIFFLLTLLFVAGCTTSNPQAVPTTPSLSATVSGVGNVSPGQTGASYTITVSNAAGAAATSGTVTVTDPPSSNFTVTGISAAPGSGWTCVLATLTCTNSNPLAGGQSYGAITVTGTVAAGTAGQSITVPITIMGGGITTTVNITPTISIVSPPTISKAFAPTGIGVNGTSTLTFTITNTTPNFGQTGVAFTDALPTGLVVAATPAIANTCTGTPSAAAGSGAVSLTGGTVPAGPTAICTLSVNVTATAAGSFSNTVNGAGIIKSTNGGTGVASNTATLTAAAPPTISKAFGASTIPLANGNTTLTFTITNPAANLAALTGVAFTDNFPAGLAVAATPNVVDNCGGTVTAAAGTGVFSLANGGSAAPGGTCTLSVNVTGTAAGAQVNTTLPVSSAQSGAGAASSPATLAVVAPPTIAKAFAPTSIPLSGGTSVLTFTITNPGANTVGETGVAFSDTLPTGMVVAGTPNIVNTCGGTPTTTAGSVSLASGTIAATGAGATCTLSVNVTGTTAGSLSNTTGTVSSTNGGTGTTSNAAALAVVAPPTISKAFLPAGIAVNGTSTLTFTVTNPSVNTVGLTGLAFTDTLPTGVAVASTPGLTDTCGGTPATTSGSVSLTGGAITATGASAMCTLSVNVTATAAGTFNNTTGAISSTNGGTGAVSNTATLSAAAPPTIGKVFAPASIPLSGGTSVLTFTITNPAANPGALTGVAFTDNFPAGMAVSGTPGLTNTCGGTPMASSGTVSLSGGTITTPGATCTISVNVTGTAAGAQVNTTLPVSSAQSGAGAASSPATLAVVAPPTIAKAFAPTSIPLSGGTSVLTFTITNPGANTVGETGVAFSDTLPTGMVVAGTPNIVNTCGGTPTTTAGSVSLASGTIAATGAGATCTLSVNVTGTTAGSLSNTTGTVSSTNGGTGTTSNTAALAVVAPPTISEAFGASGVAVNGTTTLTFTVTNPAANTVGLTGVAFSDTLPTGLIVASTPNIVNTCGGTPTAAAGTVSLASGAITAIGASATCTLSLNVTATAAGTFNNTTGAVSSANGGTGLVSNTATLNAAAPPTISIILGTSEIPVNGTTTLTFAIANPVANTEGLSGVAFTDNLPAGLVLGSSPLVSNSCGGTTAGVTAGSSSVGLSAVTLATSANCTLIVNLTSAAAGTFGIQTLPISSTQSGAGSASNNLVLVVVAPPTISEALGASGITVGGTTTLTYTITNPAANTVGLTGVAFSDTFPTGLVVASTTGLTDTCGGTAAATAGSGSVTLSNGAIATPGATCTVTVNVSATAAGTFSNTTGAISSTNGGTGAASNTVTLSAAIPPTISKAFGVSSIPLSGTTSLTFTIANPAGNVASLSGLSFTDNFPAGLVVAATPNLTNSCAGTPTASGGSISLSGGISAAPGSNCSLSVNVSGTTAGSKPNTTSALMSAQAGTGATSNTATLTVIAPPTITKAFGAPSIPLNGNTTLTFTITNPNATNMLTGIGFTDTFPAGSGMSVMTSSSGSCGGGTITDVAGSTSVSLTGATLAGGGSCNFSLVVTGTTTGVVNNVTSNITSNEGGSGNTGSASLTVGAPPTISKAFAPATVAVGGTSTLTFTITNPAANATPVTGLAFSDTFPAGLTVAATPALTNTCGGTPATTTGSVSLTGGTVAVNTTCTLSVNVTATAAGSLLNTSGAVTSTNDGTGNTASATLTAFAAPTINKAFGASTVPLNGTTSLTFTITNPAGNTAAITGLAFSDTFPAGLTVASTPGLTNTCSGTPTAAANSGSVSLVNGTSAAPGITCTISLNVAGTSAGAKLNTTGAISSTQSGTGLPSNTATLTVIAPPTISKAFGASIIPVGGTTSLNFTIINPNATTLSGIGFTDALTGGLQVNNDVGGSCVSGGTGFPETGFTNGSTSLTVSGGFMATSCPTEVLSLNVIGTTAGVINNTTSVITSTEGGTGVVSNTATLTVLAAPTINPPTPNPAAVGASITIAGSNFGPSQAAVSGTVSINGASATVTGWTSTSITATVPAGATATGNVFVTVLGVNSNTEPFTLSTPATFTSANSATFTVAQNGNDIFLVKTTGGNPTPTLSITVGSLPAAVSFIDLGNGSASIYGIPVSGTANSYPITIAAHNGAGPDVTQSFTLSVVQPTQGTVQAWGDNTYGNFGNGTTTNSSTPVGVGSLTGVVSVVAADASELPSIEYSLALKGDGTVWAWGDNSFGELGNGTSTSSTKPVQVSNLSNVVAIAAEGGHSHALESNGTVWSWGSNSVGQLGNGTQTSSTTPVQVSSLSNIVAIAAGENEGVALKSDGTVWSWGDIYNASGNEVGASTPVQLSGLSGVAAIAAGSYHDLALKYDGTVWAWGDDGEGDLGNGTSGVPTGTPVQASGLTGVESIAAGFGHSTAVKSDGTVWTWGYGVNGALGNGTTTNSSTPVQVTSLTGAASITAGQYYTLVQKSDGTVWAFGYNGSGQLGNGTTTDSSTPVQVSHLAGVTDISAGLHSLAVTTQAPAITSFAPGATTINIGQMTTLTAVFSGIDTPLTATVNNGVGTVTSGTPVNISPTVTTTYTLTVTNSIGTLTTLQTTVTVLVQQPTITKAFSPSVMESVTGTSTMSFTINNSNAVALTGVGFTDTLPTGLTVANTPGVSNSCGGTASATSLATSVSLTFGTVPANGSCVFSVSVASNSTGTLNNTTGAISSNQAGTGSTSNTASVTVLVAPTINVPSPDTQAVGASIIITGLNFGPSQAAVSGSVSINGATATVTNWTSTSITATVPSGATATGNVFVTVLGVASNMESFTVQTCTTNCMISGQVTGPWNHGVSVALSGGATATTTTDANGNYSFTGLTAGTYTITVNSSTTPALLGYNFAPSSYPGVTVNGNITGENFTETSQITSYSISGFVSYPGLKAGATLINVYPCTSCNAAGGTTLSTAPAAGGTAYTVRGLPAGSYIVNAEIDTGDGGLVTNGTGAYNASNPEGGYTGNSGVVQITSSSVTGINFALGDRTPPAIGALTAPTIQAAAPSSGAVFVSYKPSQDGFGEEVGTSYKIYYGTNSSSLTSFVTVPAGNANQVYLLSGLSTGQAYYFQMSAVDSSGEGSKAPTTPYGPVTIGNSTAGTSSILGSVNYSGTISGSAALYVGLFSPVNGIYFDRIGSPSASTPFDISGVPNGNYQIFAVLDQNGDGYIDAGDVTNLTGANGPPPFVVSGSSSGTLITLTAANAFTFVSTNHMLSGSVSTYDINVGINVGGKLPISMTLFSGPNVAVPYDMAGSQNNNEFKPIFNSSVSPIVGDNYQFLVTFSDGSTPQVISSAVNGVLTSSPDQFATNLQVVTASPHSTSVPEFTWNAPASPPSFYTFAVGLSNENGSSESWYYPQNGSGLPIGTTSAVYNSDGSAQPNQPLLAGETYNWSVTVNDANSNTATQNSSYTVPEAGVAPPIVYVGFNPSGIVVGGQTTMTFTPTNPNGSNSLSEVGFTDILNSGLQVVSAGTNTCGGTPTGVTPGSTSVGLSGVSLPANGGFTQNGQCTFSIVVTDSAVGVTTNSASNVTSLEGGAGTSNAGSVTVVSIPAPVVTSLSTNSGPVGLVLTINGMNFGSSQELVTGNFSSVSVNGAGVPELSLLSWSNTSISVIVPAGAGMGYVSVTVLGVSSATGPLSAFTITAGAVSQVVFLAQPANTGAGSTIPQFQVALEDASGNINTAPADAITMGIYLTSNPGNGTLSGTVSVTPMNGVATFSNLSINNVGTGYQLQASYPACAGFLNGCSTLSNPFNITTSTLTILTTSSQLPTGFVGTTYPPTFLQATGGSGTGYTWSVASGTLPTGLALNGAGAITNSPDPTAAGPFTFVAQVKDSASNTTTMSLTITVTSTLTVTTASLPTGLINTQYAKNSSAFLTAAGGTMPYVSWTITSGNLPPGLTLNGDNGAIYGTPTASGSFPITVQVKDSANATASASLSIPVSGTLEITSNNLQTAELLSTYQNNLSATGGVQPYTNWSVVSGSLPAGLSLNPATGVISGTLTSAAQVTTYNFTVQVQDSASNTARADLSMDIVSNLHIVGLELAGTSGANNFNLPSGVLSAAYPSTLISAAGGFPPYSNWGSTNLPGGLSINPNTGVISGTPSATGTFAGITLHVQDSTGFLATSPIFTMKINASGGLVISTASLPTANAGTAYSTGLAATGGTGTGYTWTATTAGTTSTLSSFGLSLSSAGVISGTPTASTRILVSVTVTDSGSNTAQTTLLLTIDGTTSCGSGSESLLNGSYSFFFRGFQGAGIGSPFASAGSFTTNAMGQITAGEEDVNGTATGGYQHLTINTSASSYSVGSDNRGCLNLVFVGGATGTARFALGGLTTISSSTVSTSGQLIEFSDNSGNGSGTRGSGMIFRQNPAAFVSTALQPNYAFGMDGWDPTGGKVSSVGTFTLNNTSGVVSAGYLDYNDAANGFSATGSGSGSIGVGAISSATGRTNMTFSAGGNTYDWEIYVVNASQFLVISTDPISTNTPLTVGRGFATGAPGSFSNTSLNGNYIIHGTGFDENGSTSGVGVADVILGLINLNNGVFGSASTIYEYENGQDLQVMPLLGITYSVDPASGRVLLQNTGGGGGAPVFYLVTPTDDGIAAIYGSGGDEQFGYLDIQANPGTYSNSSIAGAYDGVIEDPGDNTINDISATDTFTAGVGTGTRDISAVAGLSTASNPITLEIGPDGTGDSGINTVAITNGTKFFTIGTAPGSSAAIRVYEQESPAVTVALPELPSGEVGVNYPSATFTALGGSGTGYTWSIASGSLPTGLSLNSTTGAIINNPHPTTAAGSPFSFTVKVMDSLGNTATSGPLSITIYPALTLTPPGTFPVGSVGASYPAQTFTASGGSGGGYTFTLASGSLPGPLILDLNGSIASAVPMVAGTYPFTVKVTDSAGDSTISSGLSITVSAGPLSVIAPASLPAGTVGVPYPEEGFGALGGSGTGYTFTIASGSLPPGLTLSSNGTITNNPYPTTTSGSPFTFTVKVTDSSTNTATSSPASSIAINANTGLVITVPSLPNGTVGTSYPPETFTASGGTGPYTWVVSTGALQSDLAIGSSTGSITGTPTVSGASPFTVQVTDSLGHTAATSLLSITVAGTNLTISTAVLPSGVPMTSYFALLSASGGTPPYVAYTITGGTLPAGLSLSADTGEILGTPSSSAPATSFTVQVKDSAGTTATKSLSITVNATLTINATTLSPGFISTSYTDTLTATGGTGTGYTWSLATSPATLPTGLAVSNLTVGSNVEGEISGTITSTTGSYTFTIQVKDSGGNTATASLFMEVLLQFKFNNNPLPSGVLGQPYPGVSLNVSPYVTGGFPPYKNWSVTSGSLPPGLNLDPNLGTISGTVSSGDTVTTYSFTAQVQDTYGETATSGTFSLTIDSSLAITTTVLPTATLGVPYSFQLAATGGTAPYTWTAVSVGNGLSLSTAGLLTGTPTAVGSTSFTATVTDSASNVARLHMTSLIDSAMACGSGNEGILNGSYAFYVQGFQGGGLGTYLTGAGSFTATGAGGGISGGDFDSNGGGGSSGNEHDTIFSTGSSFSVGPDNRGCMTLALSSGNSITLHFALGSVGAVTPGVAAKGRLESWSATNHVAGIMLLQTPSAFSTAALASRFAFGMDGFDVSGNHAAMGGSFSLGGGSISSGYFDYSEGSSGDNASLYSVAGTASGSIGTVSGTGRATATYDAGTGNTYDWVIYVVNENQFLVMSIDPLGTNTPLVVGRAISTGGSFSNSVFSGNYIFHITGYVSLQDQADVILGRLSADGNGNISNGSLYEYINEVDGFIYQPLTGTYSIGATSGRVVLNGGGNQPILYVVNPTPDGIAAFIIDTDNTAGFGLSEKQPAGTLTDNSIAGPYIYGPDELGDNTDITAGQTASVGSATFTAGVGTLVHDNSNPSGDVLNANTPTQICFAINPDGTGTFAFGSCGATSGIAVTNGTKIFYFQYGENTPAQIHVYEQ